MTLLLLTILAGLRAGPATAYTPRDRYSSSTLATGRTWQPGSRHVAHRTLPLGSRGVLCSLRTLRCARVRVLDRGPYGAVAPCGTPPARRWRGLVRRLRSGLCWQPQIRLAPGWRRRGEWDVSPPVARAIGLRAFDRAVWMPR